MKKIPEEALRLTQVSKSIGGYINDLEKRWKDQGASLIKVGFEDLDDLFDGGLNGGELIILAARPAMGKSALSLQIAEQISKNIPVLYFSLEMLMKEIIERLVIRFTGIESKKLKTGKLDQTDFSKIANIIPELNKTNIYVNDYTSHTEESIIKTVDLFLEEYNRDADEPQKIAVVIDYLQLINFSHKNFNKNEAIGGITRAFKELALKHQIPIFILSQLNRSLESRPNKRPTLSDLRDSGSIEQDADIVMSLYRHEIYFPEKPEIKGMAEIALLKNRSGNLGTVHMKFDGARYKFDKISREDFLSAAVGADNPYTSPKEKRTSAQNKVKKQYQNYQNDDDEEIFR